MRPPGRVDHLDTGILRVVAAELRAGYGVRPGYGTQKKARGRERAPGKDPLSSWVASRTGRERSRSAAARRDLWPVFMAAASCSALVSLHTAGAQPRNPPAHPPKPHPHHTARTRSPHPIRPRPVPR